MGMDVWNKPRLSDTSRHRAVYDEVYHKSNVQSDVNDAA